VGKLGNPELGGVPLPEFTRRQELYRQAEISAVTEVPVFVRKAHEIYGYQHLVNDVAGSLCDLDAPDVEHLLTSHTLLLYIQVTEQAEEDELIWRAQHDPKPLYFRPAFLRKQIADYLSINKLQYAAEIDPDDFTSWIFPRLYHSRIPRYQALTQPNGYTVTSLEAAQVRDEVDFLELVERAIARHPGN
ncbi:MAG: ATPase, partial [Gammaproteobacteria bacterium]|nr:ATPase [Gammaproteobacteria bacterium]